MNILWESCDDFYKESMTILWKSQGNPMRILWWHPIPWYSYNNSIDVLWEPYGNPMIIPMGISWNPTVILQEYESKGYKTPMVILWICWGARGIIFESYGEIVLKFNRTPQIIRILWVSYANAMTILLVNYEHIAGYPMLKFYMTPVILLWISYGNHVEAKGNVSGSPIGLQWWKVYKTPIIFLQTSYTHFMGTLCRIL